MKLRDLKRLCNTQNYCDPSCPYYEVCGECSENLVSMKDEYLDRIEAECEKWLAEHPGKPKKTRQSEFLKLFPKAEIWEEAIDICPSKIGAEVAGCYDDDSCTECKRRYWLEEIEDDEA